MNISKQTLLDALLFLAPIAGKRTTLPILNYFRLSAFGDTLKIDGTDLDSFATERVECACDLDPICVNADKLINLVRSGADDIQLIATDGKLVFKSGGGRAHLSTLPAKEFPMFPHVNLVGIGVNAADLARSIRNVMWAAPPAAPDKPAKELIELKWANNILVARASDGRTVVQSEISAIASEFTEALHVRFADSVAACLEKDEATIHTSETVLCVRHKTGEFMCKKVELAPLDFKLVMERMNKPLGKIKLKPLLEVVNVCKSIVTNKWVDDMTLEFGDAINVSIENSDSSYENTVEGKTEPLTVLISTTRLHQALKQLGDFAECEITTENDTIPVAVQFAAGEKKVVVATMCKNTNRTDRPEAEK